MNFTKKHIVIGAGGHAKVLIAILKKSKVPLLGVVDSDPKTWNTQVLGIRVMGGDAEISKHPRDEVLLVNGIGSVGDSSLRSEIFERFKTQGFSFGRVIDPSALISENVELGEGVQILAGAIVQVGTSLSDNSIINTGAVIDHDCKIGHSAHIAPGAVLSGGVEVGKGAHIGTGASIIQRIRIGEKCTIGAGAAVIRDVPGGETAVGVPAKALR